MNQPEQPETSQLSRRKTLFFSLIVFIVAGALLFIAAEIIVRYTKDYSDLWTLTGRVKGPNPMRDWAYIDAFAAYSGRPTKYEGLDKTINKQGFISTPEVTLKKPADTIRIVFLGGSSTAGVSKDCLEDAETWPWITTKRLKQSLKNKKIEFINAALGGYSSFESYGRLWSRVRFYSPDIIVVCHGWNEMYYFNRVDDIISWRTCKNRSWGFYDLPKTIVYEPYWFDHLIKYSQLLTKVRFKFTPPVNAETGQALKLKKSYDKRGLDIFRSNLKLIKAAAEIMNAELYILKQATLISPQLPEEERKRCCYHFHGFDHDAHIDAFNRIYQVIDEEIPAENIIDTTSLSGVPANFFDHIHPTPTGSREIAKIVAEKLRKRLTDPQQYATQPVRK